MCGNQHLALPQADSLPQVGGAKIYNAKPPPASRDLCRCTGESLITTSPSCHPASRCAAQHKRDNTKQKGGEEERRAGHILSYVSHVGTRERHAKREPHGGCTLFYGVLVCVSGRALVYECVWSMHMRMNVGPCVRVGGWVGVSVIMGNT